MQLSSVFLSATALLAQAASGFYLTSNGNYATSTSTPAIVQYPRIGFYDSPSKQEVFLQLDSEGNLEAERDIALFDRGDGLFRLELGPAKDPNTASIRGPFSADNGELVYQGEGGLVWYLCEHAGRDQPWGLDILLGAPGLGGEGEVCSENVNLYAD